MVSMSQCINPSEHSSNFAESIKLGPWGSKSGSDWLFQVTNGGITEIIITYGPAIIDSITFKTDDRHGTIKDSNQFGTSTGPRKGKVLVDWPEEFLTTISGTLGSYSGHFAVSSLSFYTNKTKYGPFGTQSGSAFDLPIEGGFIVGFHGRASEYVDAIGVFIKPSISFHSSQELTWNQKVNSVNAEMPRFPGPWGGSKGKAWDDGVFPAIQQVNVYVGNGIIHAIEAIYKTKDGQSVSMKHGGGGTRNIKKIKLQESYNEFLVGIMGFYGTAEGNDGSEALHAITFYTNKGKYGPFGKEFGAAFSSITSDGKVVGFHGRSGVYLDALGVHMEYF